MEDLQGLLGGGWRGPKFREWAEDVWNWGFHACHRFDGEGGAVGPDSQLSMVSSAPTTFWNLSWCQRLKSAISMAPVLLPPGWEPSGGSYYEPCQEERWNGR